jgi:two-component system cell cycle sensor histidine kinase/response regulator CckA
VYDRAVGIPLRVLLLEDNPDDAALMELALARSGYVPSILRVESAVAMSDALDREPWDLIVSDYNMPTFDAPAALSLLQAHELDIPFIIVSGTVGEHAAVTSMKAGAHDYLNKNNLKRLGPAVARELTEARRRAEHRAAQKELRESQERFRAAMHRLVERIGRDTGEIERRLVELLALLDAGAADGKASPARESALAIRRIAVELADFARTSET